MSGILRCSRTATSFSNAAARVPCLCAVVLLSGVLLGCADAAVASPHASEDPRVALEDVSSAIQTEVMVRTALAKPGSDGAGHVERSLAEQAASTAVLCLLNTLIFVMAAHGLKQWGQPAMECYMGHSGKFAAASATSVQVEEDLSEEPDMSDIPACDNHNDAGVSADRARVYETVRDDTTDVGTFLIAWDCFQ
uniref:Uncharacterized protein n=1 Tax=Alexandrium catenella TaxID=2925 RepID=A0A7S1RYW1_ALECA|eukprot:CAMPEP_0171163628 /NCGR_PEP_ID=MMETSP0790-20130122/5247_1 /TAXON_ID=2925 /ORGANISM="Alexandrium catenella, Strain OF101" /LENGTH=193 /DNA_ID=CAMNT_0011628351 /DNA_START=96 /DNA_END=677 /DNA_ORIENTATION=+